MPTDPGQLETVFSHLVQNALDAVGQGGHVDVKVRREGDWVVASVQDDGPGMDEKFVREELFTPFRTTKENGYGIGAYEAKQLIRHFVVVEAEDTLGLTKSSIGIPVTFTVIHPPGGVELILAKYSNHLVMGALAFAGLALLAILVRSRVRNIPESRRKKNRKAKEDPLTQPVPALTEPPVSATKKVKSQPRFGWITRQSRLPSAPAYLIRLTNGGEPASASPIPVIEKDTTFGTDPVQSMLVLDDPSISPLHARIRQTREGYFVIMDHGSVAGTWVNYEAVPREGVRLKHGDRIHFGRLQYRFDLSQPPAESEPKVVPLK